MTKDALYAFSYAAVAGQVLVAAMLVMGLLALFGVRGPLEAFRRLIWGYELWAGFAVAAIATGGSLFYSEIAGFIPCEFCWYQRICMYPMSILLLVFALYRENRASRYLLVLPIGGALVSIYHMFIAYGAIKEPSACTITPGGCAINWLAIPAHDVTFGYLTIPTLALTGFLLLIGFLVLATTGSTDDAATLPADAER